jgi:hypothetical protein
MNLSIESLRYDLVQEKVLISIVGDVGGREVHIQLQFPFRASGMPEQFRETALLEAQQILRAAATVHLPALCSEIV